tara:strand:+ start:39046 stop:39594 length:549 start_codon:yes stop_codon:yes gene_type:complete
MEVRETDLKNVLLFKPFIHEDWRGKYAELFNEKDYSEAIRERTGHTVNFVEDNMSTSLQHVLRGIHGDDKTWKLISCLKGSIYVVIVNCDRKSEYFGKWQSFDLSDRNKHQILVPPMYGTSHLVMSEGGAFFHYKESEYYDPKNLKQFTYRFDHHEFDIWWPIKKPLLSKRDEITKEIDYSK